MRRLLVPVCTALTLGAACDGGASTTPDGADPWAAPDDPSTPDEPARSSASFAGFDLAPQRGDYWTFEIASEWHGQTTYSYLTMTLGAASDVTIDGVPARAFDVAYSDPDNTGARLGADRLAFGGERIFSYMEGKWGVLFDAWNGVWPSGGGMFDSFRAGPLGASPKSWQGKNVYEVVQAGGNECVTLPGYGTECGSADPYQAYSTLEYYAAGIGPFGKEYTGCSSGGCIVERWLAVAWRVGANVNEGGGAGSGGGGAGGCSGATCCGAANNSHFVGDQCACDEGYAWASPDPSDLRCTAASVDLELVDGAFSVIAPSTTDRRAGVCFNTDGYGNPSDRGQFLQIANTGAAAAAPFSVMFALSSVDGDAYAYGDAEIPVDTLPAGKAVTITPEGCFAIDASDLPRGTYYLVFVVDAYEEVKCTGFVGDSFA